MKISKIVFKNTGSNETMTIAFGQVNLIVGPRGGGKSTLFDLLASSQENKVPKEIIKFLNDEKYIKPEKIIYESGEEKYFASFTENSLDNIIKNDLAPNSDVISQKDTAKSGLDSTSGVLKEKKKIVEKHVKNLLSRQALKQESMREFFNFIDRVKEFQIKTETSVNWNNLFKVTSTTSGKSIISSLNFDPRLQVKNIEEVVEALKRLIEHYDAFLVEQLTLISKLSAPHSHLSESLHKDLAKWQNEDNLMIKTRIKVLNDEIKRFNKQIQYIKTFSAVLKKKGEEEKSLNLTKSLTDQFNAKSKDFFKEIAHLLKQTSASFEKLTTSEIILDINLDQKSEDNLLNYKCDKINLTENSDDIYGLLKACLYSPGTKSDYREWIKKTLEKKGLQENWEGKLDNEIIRAALDKTKVFAGGKDYEKMSPGEKSIFGIKYKLINSKGETIFIDQPEDNLDNHSITEEILPLLLQKKSQHKQIFVVTHNANIGVLTKPDKVIVANLSADEFKDIYINQTPNNIHENPKAYYLEGGIKHLKERFNLLEKEENKTWN